MEIEQFKKQFNDIVSNCDGAGLEREVSNLLDGAGFYGKKLESSFAIKLNKVIDILDGCDGSELQRELKKIRF